MPYNPQLTQEEKEAIRTSWAPVGQDMKGCGVKFFLHLFEVYPATKLVFQHFAKVPLEELASTRRFQAHGYTVMSVLTGYVNNMEDPDLMSALLIKTGENHVSKISVDLFKVVQPGVISFLEKQMGDKFTPVIRSGWSKLLEAIVGTVVEGYEAEQSRK